jgi:TolA-binding protein
MFTKSARNQEIIIIAMKHQYSFLLALLIFTSSISSIMYAQDTRENAEFKLAVGLYNDGLYELAEDQFSVFVDKFPNTSLGIEARYYLGQIQFNSKKFAEARNTFQDFALRHSDNPKAPDAWWFVGEAFETMRNFPEAASAFSRLKTFYPKHSKAPGALIAASRNFLKAGDIANAKLVLNSIVIEYSQSEAVKEANFALGLIYTAEGEFRKAIREFDYLVSSPDVSTEIKANAIVATGRVQDLMGERERAEQSFQEVISSYPKSKAVNEAYVRLGDVQRKQGSCSLAGLNYDRVMNNTAAADDIRQDAYKGAAECAVRSGDYTKASSIYSDMFETFKGMVIAPVMYRSAAKAAKQSGDYSRASGYLESLYNDTLQQLDRAYILAEMASISAEGGNHNEAAQRYKEFVEKYPKHAGASYALLALGNIYNLKFGNRSRAVELYGQVVDRFNASPIADEAQYRKAEVLEAAGDFVKAQEGYRQLLSQFPASSFYNDAFQRIQAIDRSRPGNPEDALQRIADVLSKMNSGQGSGEVDYLLGNLYLNDLKKYDEASKHFTAALSKGLSGQALEGASYGNASASARMYQGGAGSKSEAERLLSQFISQYPSSEWIAAASYDLYNVQSESGTAADRLAACENYIASGAKDHLLDVRIERGKALYELGRSADAENEFTSILNNFSSVPEHVELYYWRGVIRRSNSDFTGAKKDLDFYTQRSSYARYSAEAFMQLGKVSLRTGDYDRAVKSFETLAKQFPYAERRHEADIALLDALLEAGLPDRALYKAEGFWTDASGNPFLSDDVLEAYLYQYAVTFAKSKNAGGAKRVLHEYVERFPKGAHISDVYFALGQLYKDEGKISLATSYLKRAGASGQNKHAGRAAADLYMENGNYHAAIREYRALASSEQTQVGKTYALSRVVVALFKADSLSEAVGEAESFRSQYPDAESISEEFTIEQGEYYFRQRQYESAENYFDRVEDSDNKVIASLAHYWIGKTLEGRNKNQDAIEKFTEVIEDFPRTEGAIKSMLALGAMKFRAEQFSDAAIEFKKVVDLGSVSDTELKLALNGLIKCYDYMRYFDAAIEMSKRFIEAYPNDPTNFSKRIDLGVFYYQLRYFDQAITHLESLLAEANSDHQAEIRYYIGESYYYKGDFSRAALEFLKVPYLVVRKTEMDWASSSYGYAAKCYEELGKYNLAIEMYDKIVKTPGVDARFKAQATKDINRLNKLLE